MAIRNPSLNVRGLSTALLGILLSACTGLVHDSEENRLVKNLVPEAPELQVLSSVVPEASFSQPETALSRVVRHECRVESDDGDSGWFDCEAPEVAVDKNGSPLSLGEEGWFLFVQLPHGKKLVKPRANGFERQASFRKASPIQPL